MTPYLITIVSDHYLTCLKMRARGKQRPTEKKKRVVLMLYSLGKNSEKPKRWVGEGGRGGGGVATNATSPPATFSLNFPTFQCFSCSVWILLTKIELREFVFINVPGNK